MVEKQIRRKSSGKFYIHDDLGNAAHHFLCSAQKLYAGDNREGGALELMAGITMLAFAVEARFNFLGDRLMGHKWNENNGIMKKVEKVLDHLGKSPDYAVRPYLNICELKTFRNTLAHGKPAVIEREDEIQFTGEEVGFLLLDPPKWQKRMNLQFFEEAYDDMEKIWSDLLLASNIPEHEARSGWSGSKTLIYDVKK